MEAYVKLAGVSYNLEACRRVKEGDEIQLVPEPENPVDKMAILVINAMQDPPEKIGYIPAVKTRIFHPVLDSGAFRNAHIHKVEPEEGSVYINIALCITYDIDALAAWLKNRPNGD